jgi:hypothetical protein
MMFSCLRSRVVSAYDYSRLLRFEGVESVFSSVDAGRDALGLLLLSEISAEFLAEVFSMYLLFHVFDHGSLEIFASTMGEALFAHIEVGQASFFAVLSTSLALSHECSGKNSRS